MSESSIGVCLLGCGIVGGGVVKILTEQAELLRHRTGLRFDIRHVVVRDPAKARGFNLKVSTDVQKAVAAPDTDIVVELMGGTGMGKVAVEQALRGQAGGDGQQEPARAARSGTVRPGPRQQHLHRLRGQLPAAASRSSRPFPADWSPTASTRWSGSSTAPATSSSPA